MIFVGFIVQGTHYQREYDLRDFAGKMQEDGMIIDIVDETYGYNLARFGCYFTESNKWFSYEIEIYHSLPMKFAWKMIYVLLGLTAGY